MRTLALVAALVVAGGSSSSAAADAPPVPDEIALKPDARLEAWRLNRRAPGVGAGHTRQARWLIPICWGA